VSSPLTVARILSQALLSERPDYILSLNIAETHCHLVCELHP